MPPRGALTFAAVTRADMGPQVPQARHWQSTPGKIAAECETSLKPPVSVRPELKRECQLLIFNYLSRSHLFTQSKAITCHGLERQLHQQYESKRINGEWFSLDEIDINGFVVTMKGIATQPLEILLVNEY